MSVFPDTIPRRPAASSLTLAAGPGPVVPADRSVPELVERVAARRPHAVALRFGDAAVDYRTLCSGAAGVAARLTASGIGRGDVVAVIGHHSAALVTTLLGILRAGAAYLPLTADDPPARSARLAERAGAVLTLTGEDLERFSRDPVLRPDPPLGSPLPVTGADLAAVMFTSGSTGTPKGAAIPHRAVVRLVLGADYAALTPADSVVFVSNIAFDALTFELWGPLLTGGTVVGLERDALLSTVSLGRRLAEIGATAMFMSTGLFHLHARLAPDGFRGLDHLLVGGEALSPAAVRAVLAAGPPRNLRNIYGPTEATTFSTSHDIGALPDTAATVPIGRPIANTRAYLLDAERRPVPIGETGELYIGGLGVALGYHREPELTAERFSADPWLPGERMYRTGDFAVWTPEHVLEFQGRRDDQVKLRGFRIELGEVEAAVRALPEVAEAVVVVRGEGAARTLEAYAVLRNGAADPSSEDIKARLAVVLPAQMVPTVVHPVEQLPLTINGKVDRRAVTGDAP